MKKIFFILLVTVFLHQQSNINNVDVSKELTIITDVAINEGLILEEWQVVMINKVLKKEFDNITKRLLNSYLVTVLKDDNNIKYVFEAKNSNDYFNHYFQAIVPNNQDDVVNFQTVISGEVWNDSVQNYYNDLTKDLQSEFTIKFNKIYTCVKLNDDGIINGGFSDDEIWKKMKVVHKSEQYDNIQQSVYEKEVYGYTPLWNSKITVENEVINFHMIIKNNERNKKQVIIGTPIILNEY